MIMVEQKRDGIINQTGKRLGVLVARMQEDIKLSRKAFDEGYVDIGPDVHISPSIRLARLEAARPFDPPAELIMLEDSIYKLPNESPMPLP